MKKLLAILLTLLTIFTLVGCGPKKIEEQPVEVEPTPVVEPAESEIVLGGWIDVEDGAITDELKDLFNKALEGLLGGNYEPVKLLATQVVNGTNYKFLANGTKATNPITVGTYNITINESTDGTISLLDIEVVEEKQEEQEKKDPTKYSYWVVFYDQNGVELQRTIEPYGTVPSYKGQLPGYFEKWVNKKTKEDITSFKPITTNTYFEAVCFTPQIAPAPVIKKYTVTFMDGDSIISTQTVEDGKTVTKPADPEKSGFTFTGWYYKEAELSYLWDFDLDPVTDNINLYASWNACLAKGTLITMANGSRKPIEEIKIGDDVRVFNHDTGKLSRSKVLDLWQYEEQKQGLITLHFTNDINVNIVSAHGFYNKEENKYVVLDKTNINDYVGKHFYNADDDAWETLLGATYSDEKVDTFFIATQDQFDVVAEGMLTVEDGLYCLVANTFDFDSNMKVNKFKKYFDILKYGLFTYKDLPVVEKEAFKVYKLPYIKVAIGKGLITQEAWEEGVKIILTYESDYVKEEYIPEKVQHNKR